MPNDGSKSFQSNLHFKESCDGEIDKQKQFIQIVNSFAGAEIDSLEHKANNLLHDLHDFEKVFAKYIVKECDKRNENF